MTLWHDKKRKEKILKNGVRYLTVPERFEGFQTRYLAVRQKENRILTDEQVYSLPYLPANHPLHKEWLMRADTMTRFIRYLKKNPLSAPVLDLGCGNGWFPNKIAELTGQEVIGLDVNIPELEQAARVFTKENLTFCFGDIYEDIFEPKSFGMITLNASAQYFPDIIKLINRLLELLKDDGEINILDTPLYPNDKAARDAADRTKSYYTQLGFPEMASHYHHHPIQKLLKTEGVKTAIVYKTSNIKHKTFKLLRRRLSPFPWIRIRFMVNIQGHQG
jgi:SAM-dependent methyltransferase